AGANAIFPPADFLPHAPAHRGDLALRIGATAAGPASPGPSVPDIPHSADRPARTADCCGAAPDAAAGDDGAGHIQHRLAGLRDDQRAEVHRMDVSAWPSYDFDGDGCCHAHWRP